MKILSLLILLSMITYIYSEKWAIIVASSEGYQNYRHQADSCHAYQILIQGGYKPENIIHFAKNDIAYHSRNPFPGKLFNKPDVNGPGYDVYAGCKIDYQGSEVTISNFLAVLQGQKSSKLPKVLNSTLDDNVFLYMSDHGGPNFIAFPGSAYLYKDELWAAFKNIESKQMYKKFVWYVEACESGSMCSGLTMNSNFYCLTAANETEVSNAAYCGEKTKINGQWLYTCLGDEFSVNWLEYIENNPRTNTLQQQYDTIQPIIRSNSIQWVNTNFTSDTIESVFGQQTKTQTNTVRTITSDYEIEDNSMTTINYLKRMMEIDIHDKEIAKQYFAEISLHDFLINMFQKLKDHFRIMKQESMSNSHIQNWDMSCYRNLINTFENNCKKVPDHAYKYMRVLGHICYYYPNINQLLFAQILKKYCKNNNEM